MDWIAYYDTFFENIDYFDLTIFVFKIFNEISEW